MFRSDSRHVSEDWKAGDAALCIKVGDWICPEDGRTLRRPIKGGQFCTVEGVVFKSCYKCGVGLVLKEDQTVAIDGERVNYSADRFVKINPDDLFAPLEREKELVR